MSLFDAKEASTFGLFQPKVAQSIIAPLIRGWPSYTVKTLYMAVCEAYKWTQLDCIANLVPSKTFI